MAVLVLGLLVLSLGVVYIHKKYQLVIGSAKVEARAAELLPGAKAPSGLRGVIALCPEPELQIAAFAPTFKQMNPENLEGSDLRIIVVKPKTSDKPDLQEIIKKVQDAKTMKRNEMEELEKGPARMEVGGVPYLGLKSLVALKSNGKKLQERLVILAPRSEIVIVTVIGPDETFNQKAVDEFFAGLSEPLPIPGLPALPKTLEVAPPELPPRPKLPRGIPGGGPPKLPGDGPPGLP